MTTYLKDFEKMAKRGIAYLPVGTLEWHGNHLPIETDYLVAVRLCDELVKKKPGYILPPIYVGSGTKKKINGKWLIGMDKYLRKKLAGNVYFFEPEFLAEVLVRLGKNLTNQGFKKVFVVTGHGGTGQTKALSLAAKKLKNFVIINPYDILEERGLKIGHADEYETSLFWACYPGEEKKSRSRKIPNVDDLFRYYGYDPRKKATLAIGRKILNEILKNCSKLIKS